MNPYLGCRPAVGDVINRMGVVGAIGTFDSRTQDLPVGILSPAPALPSPCRNGAPLSARTAGVKTLKVGGRGGG